MFRHLIITNPKRNRRDCIGRASWYPYYPGFSSNFAHSLLASSGLPSNACVTDPWNGSGTTTAAAAALGYRTHGYDLNPVMVICAKARLLNRRERPSLWPIAADILDKVARDKSSIIDSNDPLCTWLTPSSAAEIRKLERSLQQLLVDDTTYQLLITRNNISSLSDLSAFFYTALFRTTRAILKRFFTTNPTWIKQPQDKATRLSPSLWNILDIFKVEIIAMITAIDDDPFNNAHPCTEASINIASSDALPTLDNSVDLILASPPYCTRIDYAVATIVELAILGYKPC